METAPASTPAPEHTESRNRTELRLVIVACTACHRQIDVGAHAAGAKVRCFCGALNSVPSRTARDAKMQNCSNCGAALHAHESKCQYCTAPVSKPDRGLGDACPSCLARLVAGAKYCSSCGLAIAPQIVLTALPSLVCPCCKGTLAECRTENMAFVECTACAGMWLDASIFQRVIKEAQSRGETAITFREPTRAAIDQKPENAPLYRPCPVCRDIMPRRNYGKSGIIIDWCGRHGYWFDADELSRLLALARDGKLEKETERRKKEVASRKESFLDGSSHPRFDSSDNGWPTFVWGLLRALDLWV